MLLRRGGGGTDDSASERQLRPPNRGRFRRKTGPSGPDSGPTTGQIGLGKASGGFLRRFQQGRGVLYLARLRLRLPR